MKVIEKGTDRRAEVHLHAQGVIDPLDEYGEYVDPVDNAICCFVPVEEGQKIRVDGRFNGTTLTVQYDISIDGVCRKANIYASKTVTNQRTKKIGCEKFLFQTDHGIVDSEIIVRPLPTKIKLQKDASATLGTIELRLSIVRRFGDQHALQDIPPYFDCMDEGYDEEKSVGYKGLFPDLRMGFEKDCATLEIRKANAEERKMKAARPGGEPWAIFRFHYRNKEAIEDSDLAQTFDANAKSKSETHVLKLKELPMLTVGSKPSDTAGTEDASTCHSSPERSIAGASTSAPKSPALQKSTKAATPTSAAQPSPKALMRSLSLDISEASPEDHARLQRSFTNSSPKPTPMPPPTVSGSATAEGIQEKKTSTYENVVEQPSRDDEIRSNSVEKPTPILSTIKTPSQIAPTVLIAPMIPTKRPSELSPPPSPSPEPKHAKVSTASSSTAPTSIERQIADMRRRLAAAKEKRENATEKAKKLDKELAPFHQRMQEEWAKLQAEVVAEELSVDEAEKDADEKEIMLREYQEGAH